MRRIDHLAFRYGERRVVLEDLTIEFHAHEVSYVVGPSGTGKTTLALLLAGELKPDSGCISPDDCATLVMQFPELLFLEHSLTDELRSLRTPESQTRANTLLNRFGIEIELFGGKSPEHLSFAQKRLIGIALQSAQSAGAIVMDEPTLGLDDENLHIVGDFIVAESMAREFVAVITHDLDLIQMAPGRVYIIANGRCAWHGISTEFLLRRDLLELANAI